MNDYKEWLDQTLVFNDEIETFFGQHCIIETDPAVSDDMDEDVPGTSQEANMGHPAKNWDTLSHRSKKRKVQNLLEDRGPEELLYAASQGVYKKNANLKYVLKFAMLTSSRPAKIRKLISEKKSKNMHKWRSYVAVSWKKIIQVAITTLKTPSESFDSFQP